MNFKLFRPLSYGSIQKSLGHSHCEFKSWIATGKYQVSNISTNGDVELHVLDHAALAETIGYDFARFSCASFESMREISSDSAFPKATAWAGIRAYYAAFFGAHAILRYFGISCSQIEPSQATLLSRYASLYGIQNKAQSGFYAAEFSAQNNTLKLRKLNDTHKDTWSTFNAKSRDLSTAILNVPGLSKDRNDISNLLTSISDSLSSSGRSASGNWLSTFRNNLNYRHDYHAWYPYKKHSLKFEQIERYLNDWQDPEFNPNLGLLEKDERIRFFGSCAAIVYLASGIAADLASNAEKGSIHRTRTARFSSIVRA